MLVHRAFRLDIGGNRTSIDEVLKAAQNFTTLGRRRVSNDRSNSEADGSRGVRARSRSFPLGGVTSGMAVLRGIRAGTTMTRQSAKSFGGRTSFVGKSAQQRRHVANDAVARRRIGRRQIFDDGGERGFTVASFHYLGGDGAGLEYALGREQHPAALRLAVHQAHAARRESPMASGSLPPPIPSAQTHRAEPVSARHMHDTAHPASPTGCRI